MVLEGKVVFQFKYRTKKNKTDFGKHESSAIKLCWSLNYKLHQGPAAKDFSEYNYFQLTYYGFCPRKFFELSKAMVMLWND